MAEKCKCGHSCENHSMRGAFLFCEGTTMATCPCGLYEPSSPSGEVAQPGPHNFRMDSSNNRCLVCGAESWDKVHNAQIEPQPAGTEQAAWSEIIKWAYENAPDAVVAIHALSKEVIEARSLKAQLAALKQSYAQCVEALWDARGFIGVVECEDGLTTANLCGRIDAALADAAKLTQQ